MPLCLHHLSNPFGIAKGIRINVRQNEQFYYKESLPKSKAFLRSRQMFSKCSKLGPFPCFFFVGFCCKIINTLSFLLFYRLKSTKEWLLFWISMPTQPVPSVGRLLPKKKILSSVRTAGRPITGSATSRLDIVRSLKTIGRGLTGSLLPRRTRSLKTSR